MKDTVKIITSSQVVKVLNKEKGLKTHYNNCKESFSVIHTILDLIGKAPAHIRAQFCDEFNALVKRVDEWDVDIDDNPNLTVERGGNVRPFACTHEAKVLEKDNVLFIEEV